MATISSAEFFQLYASALPLCLSILAQDRELKSLEFLPSSGPLCLLDSHDCPKSLFLRPDFAIGRTTMLNGHWQKQECDFFAQHIQQTRHGEPISLVDVGANIGLFTRQLLSMVGDAVRHAWCYEPDRDNFELMQRNLGFLQHVNLIEVGLSLQESRIKLFQDPGNSGNYSFYEAMMPGNQFATSEVTVLPAQEQAAAWLEPGLPIYYKSDTQGHDMAIAGSLDPMFWSEVVCVVLELCPLAEQDYEMDSFASMLDCFNCKVFSDHPRLNVGTQDIVSFLRDPASLGSNRDLFLWRQ